MLVTNGGKQAVYQAFATVLDPGDEVLLPAPYWTTYPEAITLAGGVPVEVFAGEDQGYLVTVEQLEAARTPRTKALLFCSPSATRPARSTRPSRSGRSAQWALEHGVWVITDEIYEHLTYDGAQFSSMPVQVPELADTCIVLNGVAKTYAMTGWRVGWMIGPRDVVKAATNLQSHLTSNVANVSQRAAIAAVTGDLAAVATMREAFDRRRRTIVSMLNEIDGVDCPTPQGAFYAYPSVKGVLGRDDRRAHAADVGRAGRADPGGGRGGRRAGRGVRAERLPAAVLRARATTTWSRASAGSRSCSPRPCVPTTAGPASLTAKARVDHRALGCGRRRRAARPRSAPSTSAAAPRPAGPRRRARGWRRTRGRAASRAAASPMTVTRDGAQGGGPPARALAARKVARPGRPAAISGAYVGVPGPQAA